MINRLSPSETTPISYTDIFNDTQVSDFLGSEGVDIDAIRSLDVDARPAELIRLLFTDTELDNIPARSSQGHNGSDLGIVIVKPEALPYIDEIEVIFNTLGTKPEVQATKLLSKDEWLAMYGYILPERPEIVNVYVTQRSLGMTAMLFNHLTKQDYLDYAKSRKITIDNRIEDINKVFDGVFCGSSTEPSPGTLRWEITHKRLSGSSFASLSDDAVIFDPVNYYRDGYIDDLLKAFNGIHIPANSAEAQSNITVFERNA